MVLNMKMAAIASFIGKPWPHKNAKIMRMQQIYMVTTFWRLRAPMIAEDVLVMELKSYSMILRRHVAWQNGELFVNFLVT